MFLIRPRPISGESLSSWRQRAGKANGFREFPLMDERRRRFDADRWPNVLEVKWLAEEFRVEETAIHMLSLDSLGSRLSTQFSATSKPRWVIPVGKRQSGTGGMYCPQCLREDTVPHFRLAWRMAFLTTCPTHGCKLMENCPRCNAGVWPLSNCREVRKNMDGIETCAVCGYTLSNAALQYSSDEHSAPLWSCVTSGVPPPEFVQASNALEVFSALWVFSQLFIRNQSSKLLPVLPVGSKKIGNEVSSVELMALDARENVLRGAYWLLQEWPERLLYASSKCQLSRHHFTVSRSSMPAWLKEIVDLKLTRRHSTISKQHAQEAIQALKATGEKLSKSAVCRVLNISEAKALNELIGQRRRATILDVEALCAAFEKKLVHASIARDEAAVILRDYLIFLIALISNSSVEKVCRLSQLEVGDILKGVDHISSLKIFMDRANSLNDEFSRSARIQLLNNKNVNAPWFIGRFGVSLDGHSVRARIAKLMRDHCAEDLWNSANVFKDVPIS